MRIAMLVPGLAPHDAISNDALGMTAALRRLGHEVALFANHARDVDEPVHAPDTIEAWLQSSQDVIVYHYCTGWTFALELLRRTRARRVVRYHNITPPEFFAPWSDGYVAVCSEGRAQLDAFAALGCELYLGDSPYNLEDFTARGVDTARCAVVAPFHQVDELLRIAPDARRLPRGAPLLLMVGRLSPNKAHLDLLDCLAACVAGGDADAHLLSIGKLDPTLKAYGDALDARIAARGLASQVTLMQDADGAELRAAYERADALVVLSRHEGFCVPLIEAMALGTPIVALASSAMPWTIGDAGIVWDSSDPQLVAATLARLRSDGALRETLSTRGRMRYANAFAPDVLASELETVFRRFLP